MVAALGVNISLLNALLFALGSALAALAGAMAAMTGRHEQERSTTVRAGGHPDHRRFQLLAFVVGVAPDKP